MKKPSFYFFALAMTTFLASCGNDTCTIVGNWKVKSADMKSEKLDATVLEMAKANKMAMQYSFTADSVTIKAGTDVGNFAGAYKFDELAKRLSWEAIGAGTGMPYTEEMKIVECSGDEITLQQRTPSDTTKAAITTTTLVLERVGE